MLKTKAKQKGFLEDFLLNTALDQTRQQKIKASMVEALVHPELSSIISSLPYQIFLTMNSRLKNLFIERLLL